MANRQQVLNEISAIINNGFAAARPSFEDKVNLRGTINKLLTESNSNPTLVKFMEPYDKALNEGTREELISESFANGLKVYADVFPDIKDTYKALCERIEQNRYAIGVVNLFESIKVPYIKESLYDDVVAFANRPSQENRIKALRLLEQYSLVDFDCARLQSYLTGNANVAAAAAAYTDPVGRIDESASGIPAANVVEINGKQYVEKNGQYLPVVNEQKIMEGVTAYIDGKLNEQRQKDAEEEMNEQRSFREVNNNIQLAETIRSLMEKEGHNRKLMGVLSEYGGQLMRGRREEGLYESFIKTMKNGFDFINEVQDEVKAMEQRAAERKVSIRLTELMEMISLDGEYHVILPLIESDVVRYQENPNATNRSILFNTLHMYEHCPYVVEMLYTIAENRTKKGLLMAESGQFIRNHAHLEDVYSPVQYIKENECVFNVQNQFYVKKGTHITKLDPDCINNLSEGFRTLCRLVNDPLVTISNDDITYLSKDGDTFIITEGQVMLPCTDEEGKEVMEMETVESLRNLNEMFMKYGTYDQEPFLTAAFLCEHFDDIAKVDFVKTIRMNEDYGKSLDLFRLKENVFIMAHDELNESHMFYRNVNPIQLANTINNHFGIKVSGLFEDMLPNQSKIIANINEMKVEYENRIEKLTNIRGEYQAVLEAAGVDDKEKIQKDIDGIDRSISEAKKEYMEFQKNVKELYEGKKGDKNAKNDLLDTAQKLVSLIKNEDFEGGELNDGSEDDDPFDGMFDGSDGDFFDGSDDDGSEYESSDGDDMTSPLDGGDGFGPDSDFETNPFTDDNIADEGESDGYIDDYSLDEPGGAADGLDTGLDSGATEDDPFGQAADSLAAETPNPEDTSAQVQDVEPAEVADDADLDYNKFKIVKIDFDTNVKTGDKGGTGKVIVVEPWVEPDGTKTSKSSTYEFYVAEIDGEKTAVLDNTEGMDAEKYFAIVDAIKEASNFDTVKPEMGQGVGPEGEPQKPVDPVIKDTLPAEGGTKADTDLEQALDADQATDVPPAEDDILDDPFKEGDTGAVAAPTSTTGEETPDPFDSGSDETTEITLDDGINPRGIDTATYKSGDTEIDLPADNISLNGEEKPKDVIGESFIMNVQGEVTNKEGKKFLTTEGKTLTESRLQTVPGGTATPIEVAEPMRALNEGILSHLNASGTENDDYSAHKDIDGSGLIAGDDFDAMALLQDVMESYIDFAEEEGIEGDAEIDEIKDYRITLDESEEDGENISSIAFRINDHDYTFFTHEDEVLLAETDAFEENSQELDTFHTWTDESDDIISRCDITDADAVVEMFTDVIKSETGEEFDYEEYDDDEVQESQKIRLFKDHNRDGKQNPKVRLKKNSDHGITTYQYRNSARRDRIVNGTVQERENAEKIREYAKKKGVSASAAQGGGQGGGMMGESLHTNFGHHARLVRKGQKDSLNESMMIPQPGDQVIFKGRRTNILHINKDDTITIMGDGNATIDVKPSDISFVDKVDTVQSPMMFDNKTLKLIDESALIPCDILLAGTKFNSEKCFVTYGSYMKTRNDGYLTVLTESNNQFSAQKDNLVLLTDIPSKSEVNLDDYVEAVKLNLDGEADRNILVDANAYATSTNDDDRIDVLYKNGDNYLPGKLRKSEIKTLSV